MIRYHIGDIWTTDADAIVIPTNRVGVMGAGLARQAATRYPSLAAWYRNACATASPCGTIHVYRQGERTLICLPTKDHWRESSDLDLMHDGLVALAAYTRSFRYGRSLRKPFGALAVPMLGCGLGGLAWGAVRPVIERDLGGLPIPVTVYIH